MAIAVLAAAMAFDAINALIFEFPVAIVLIKMFQQKVIYFWTQVLKYLGVRPIQ